VLARIKKTVGPPSSQQDMTHHNFGSPPKEKS